MRERKVTVGRAIRFTALIAVAVLAFCGVFAVMPSCAEAAGSVIRVKLSVTNKTSLTVTVKGTYTLAEKTEVKPANGVYTVSVSGSKIRIKGAGVDYTGASVTLLRDEALPEDSANLTMNNSRYGDCTYLGSMVFTASGKYITAVNHIDVEKYLYGVVTYEMSESFPVEAIKAQAVCARCYGMYSITSTGSYDLGDTSADQVYHGYDPARAVAKVAVDSTKGLVLTYNNKIIETFYSASNGGQTELVGNAFSGGAAKDAKYPYYVQKDDPYDLENPSSLVQKIILPSDPSTILCTIDKSFDKAVRIVGISTSCNVRSSPSDASDKNIIGSAKLNEMYAYLGTEQAGDDDWYKIQYGAAVGYVSSSYGMLTDNSGAFVYASAPFDDIQKQVYDQFISAGIQPFASKATSVKIEKINSISNSAQRWPSVSTSRSYVNAVINVTASCAKSESEMSEALSFDVTITLMNVGSTAGTYINSHAYIRSDLRLRGVEQSGADWYIVSRRYGHGLGMSQRGAQTMAGSHGKKLNEILAFYYPGSTLVNKSGDAPYTFGAGMVTGIKPGTELSEIASSMQLYNGSTVSLTDGTGAAKPSGILATGDILTVGDTAYAVVIYGDASGDGSINMLDLLTVQKHILTIAELGEAKLAAADVSRDGAISILDMLKIQKHLLGSAIIDQ